MADAAFQYDIHPALIFASLHEDELGEHLSDEHYKWLRAAIANHPDLHEPRRNYDEEYSYAGGDPRAWADKIVEGLSQQDADALPRDDQNYIILSVSDVARARFNLTETDDPHRINIHQLQDNEQWVWEKYVLEEVDYNESLMQAINFRTLKYPTNI
jgi:hypothetical protein